ncbi:two-component sensor histidine kinase [Sporomusaceae bacterium FL31]|nr:two-component sensor histidine kinase [Sporomusaceae bacterium FL31]GCE33187.1 two-component sensor histidine kinase [Sporomusaceae bacterium]
MFSEIRNRLTQLYVAVMAVFLVAFIVVSYTGILWVLHREEQQDIRAIADEEAREHVMLLKRKDSAFVPQSNADNDGEKIFFYVFDKDGQLVDREEPEEKMRSKVEAIIHNWQMPDGEGKIQKFYIDNNERAIVIMCSTTIYDGQEVLGRVFVGEDITSYYQLLKSLLIVLVVVAILFIVAAAFVGHLLAGRAIVPIRQSFARQREFVADASHELRTPLSILLTSVDVVQTDDGNQLSAFSVQVLDDMKSEVRRMTKMVGDLLTLARADAGVSNIIKEKFDLVLVSEQIIRSFQLVADDKGVALELDHQTPITVFADKERMSQLLLILIDNAMKYTPAGGRVKVDLRTVTGSKPTVSITVQDTGVGIPDEHKKLIFDRFYRIDKVRSREEGGSGIGLSIAKWIVDAHGGTIKVVSMPGQGSSFIVNLPA